MLNINDSNMGNYKHNIYISGENKVSGISPDKITLLPSVWLWWKTKHIIAADLMFSLKESRFGKTVRV